MTENLPENILMNVLFWLPEFGSYPKPLTWTVYDLYCKQSSGGDQEDLASHLGSCLPSLYKVYGVAVILSTLIIPAHIESRWWAPMFRFPNDPHQEPLYQSGIQLRKHATWLSSSSGTTEPLWAPHEILSLLLWVSLFQTATSRPRHTFLIEAQWKPRATGTPL